MGDGCFLLAPCAVLVGTVSTADEAGVCGTILARLKFFAAHNTIYGRTEKENNNNNELELILRCCISLLLISR